MASEPLITTYLEMRSQDQLCPKRADARFQVREKKQRDWRFNRDLYFRVGEQWDWNDRRSWTDHAWKEYAMAPELRTFAGHYDEVLAGYYELRRDRDGGVEITYFGLLPEFIGRGRETRRSLPGSAVDPDGDAVNAGAQGEDDLPAIRCDAAGLERNPFRRIAAHLDTAPPNTERDATPGAMKRLEPEALAGCGLCNPLMLDLHGLYSLLKVGRVAF